MAFTHGMNVEAVNNIGRQLKTRSSEVTQLAARVQALIAESTNNWHGQDAQQFANEWNSNYRTAMQRLATELGQLGDKALRNAAEQQQVSGR